MRMRSFNDIVNNRKQCRNFVAKELNGDDLEKILEVALKSPRISSETDSHFIIVDDNFQLSKLSDCNDIDSCILKDVAVAIVVAGNSLNNEFWIEDCSMAAVSMLYMAEQLGIGTYWVQVRKRGYYDGANSTEIIRGVLEIPEEYDVLCILGIGYAKEPGTVSEECTKWENVHLNSF